MEQENWRKNKRKQAQEMAVFCEFDCYYIEYEVI